MKGSIPGKIPLLTYTPIQTNVLSKIKNNENLTEYHLDVVMGDAASYLNRLGGGEEADIVDKVKKYIKNKYGIDEISINQLEKIKNIAKLAI